METTSGKQGKHILPGWVHDPGLHCGSTALSDVMTFSGLRLSEPFCFGLGAGLGFHYVELDGMSPSRMFHVRSSNMEPDFFASLDIPFAWRLTQDPDEAHEQAVQAVMSGRPVLLRTDIFYLDYYGSSTHFNGHVVVLWGFDNDHEQAYLSDTGWPGLQTVSYEHLKLARTSKAPPVPLDNQHFVFDRPKPSRSMEEAILVAMGKNASQMLSSVGNNPHYAYGIEGMKRLAERLADWKEVPDWKWCARFCYQVIEKRGTGGGGFRLLYRDFLGEVENRIASLRPEKLSEDMGAIAAMWSELASTLKKISEQDDPGQLARLCPLVDRLRSEEERFYQKLLRII